MALEYTGIMVGEKNSCLLIAPQSAYIVCAQCTQGCSTSFWVAGSHWEADADLATIYRTFDLGITAMGEAKSKAVGCLKLPGVIFDVKPLAGFVK